MLHSWALNFAWEGGGGGLGDWMGRDTGGGVTTTGPDATYPPAIFQNSGGGSFGGGGWREGGWYTWYTPQREQNQDQTHSIPFN